MATDKKLVSPKLCICIAVGVIIVILYVTASTNHRDLSKYIMSHHLNDSYYQFSNFKDKLKNDKPSETGTPKNEIKLLLAGTASPSINYISSQATLPSFTSGGSRSSEGKPSPNTNLSGRTYVVSINMWEQLMASSVNFLRLQCWIKTLKTKSYISAVEPQVIRNRSILGFYFDDPNPPLVSDVFDMESWYTQWPKRGPPLAPLTSKADFIADIKKFPKHVILVHMKYMAKKTPYECQFTWNISSLVRELNNYPLLNISRKVCIYVGHLPANDFNKLVFGEDGTDDKVVIFNEWRGVKPGRVDISNSPCALKLNPYGHLQPSSSVVHDAEVFANQNLGGFGHYISVSARFEKVSRTYSKFSSSPGRGRQTIADKSSEALKWVNSHKSTGLDKVYLAYDYGLYGSSTFEANKYYSASDLLIKFQEDLYDGKLLNSDYQKSLQTFKFNNPGYVAMVQMTLSSRGQCLFQIGWGHSIEYVKSLFDMAHKGGSHCYDITVSP